MRRLNSAPMTKIRMMLARTSTKRIRKKTKMTWTLISMDSWLRATKLKLVRFKKEL